MTLGELTAWAFGKGYTLETLSDKTALFTKSSGNMLQELIVSESRLIARAFRPSGALLKRSEKRLADVYVGNNGKLKVS